MTREFHDRVSLVTGASRGIGRATAAALGAAGARVALGGRDEEALAETARLVESAGGEALLLSMDVTSEESVSRGVTRALETWGRMDHLVNNAGMALDGLLMRFRPADWDKVVETNLGGAYRVTRHVLPAMVKARAGRIVNLASVIGEIGNAGQTAYGASKAGIIGFTKSVAREVAGRGITVNCVAPGLVETEMTRNMPEKARDELLSHIPLGRAGTTEDVAGTIRFLLSDAASYLTGVVLRVNGGLFM
jgi:3-oxoacyl-[acyl-carrier protein] reductase